MKTIARTINEMRKIGEKLKEKREEKNLNSNNTIIHSYLWHIHWCAWGHWKCTQPMYKYCGCWSPVVVAAGRRRLVQAYAAQINQNLGKYLFGLSICRCYITFIFWFFILKREYRNNAAENEFFFQINNVLLNQIYNLV